MANPFAIPIRVSLVIDMTLRTMSLASIVLSRLATFAIDFGCHKLQVGGSLLIGNDLDAGAVATKMIGL
jgi:hypothetical protein